MLKGIACIGVIFIHVVLPGELGIIIKNLAGFAVPFFFLVAGYFVCQENEEVVLKKRAKNIFRILLISVLLYLIYTLLYYLKFSTLQTIVNKICVRTVFDVLILGDFSIIEAQHLWFLLALLYSYIFLWMLAKRKTKKIYLILLVSLFVFRLFLIILGEFVEISWHYRSNFLLGGLPYVLLGRLIAEKEESAYRPGLFCILTGISFFIIVLLSCWEEFSLVTYLVYSFVFPICLFMLAISAETHKGKSLAFVGRQLSLYVYVFHMLVIKVGEILGNKLEINTSTTLYRIIFPIAVAVVSVILSILIYAIWNKKIHYILARKIYKKMERANNARRLKNKNATILCPTCIGGVISHKLGVQFLSPTVNLWMYEDDFYDFVLHIEEYAAAEVEDHGYHETEHYPIGIIKRNDKKITIYFNHHKQFAEAKADWDRRKKRINYDNLFVIASTCIGENEEIIGRWENVRRNVKGLVCFTAKDYKKCDYALQLRSFANREKCGKYMVEEKTKILNRFAWEKDFDYVEWLNTGKVK
ncbi:MAG: DUF1919 domain-containing protein [Lachnospiraceae bacterium]|nr:DUF1919 domain-containing protein [Lachnospiraceae bacterium]